MGQQHIESIGMYGKTIAKEWPSEYMGYVDRERKDWAYQVLDMVFNKQYGIYYYESADEMEALIMIAKFRNKIQELEARWVQ